MTNQSLARVCVIIPAAGTGSRFGGEIPKQFLPLAGKPVLQHVIERFARFDAVRIIVAIAEPFRATVKPADERVEFVMGGETRQQSVTRALRELLDDCDLVAVHDAVRPFLRRALFTTLVETAARHGAAFPALPLNDTIHVVRNGIIATTLDRTNLVAAQTPQCFRTEILRDVLERAERAGESGTDEVSLAVKYGYSVVVVPGDPLNLKITRPEDLRIAEANFDEWSRE